MAFNINLNPLDILPSSQSGSSSGSSVGSGTKTGRSVQQRIVSQEAIDTYVNRILQSEQGLAALATGESAAGLSGTAMKTQLTQDLVARIAGEIATLTSPVYTDTTEAVTQQAQQQQASSSKSKKTVICTELHRQGKLSSEEYAISVNHSQKISPYIYYGYFFWAQHVVPLMQKSERLSALLLPIVQARYAHISGKKNFLGALTVYLGHPICFLIGKLVLRGSNNHGYASN